MLTPIISDSLMDRLILGLEMLREIEQVVQKAKQNLKVARDKQKSFANIKNTSQ